MSDANQALLMLEPRDTEELLEELVAQTRRALEGEPVRKPSVTLLLGRGGAVSGFVLAIKESRRRRSLLLHDPGDDRNSVSFNVVHLPLASIEAVVIHDALELDQPPRDAPPAPSPLELKRRAAALAESLGQRLGLPFEVLLPTPLEEDQLEPLGALLRLLSEVLALIEPDALAAKVNQLKLEVKGAPGVLLTGEALVVTTVKSSSKRHTQLSLTQATEAVL